MITVLQETIDSLWRNLHSVYCWLLGVVLPAGDSFHLIMSIKVLMFIKKLLFYQLIFFLHVFLKNFLHNKKLLSLVFLIVNMYLYIYISSIKYNKIYNILFGN